MPTKKRRNALPRQKPVTAKQVPRTMNLCEVAERLELAKKEVRELLRELEKQERESGGREKLEAGLRELDELIRVLPPIHNYC